MEDVMEILLNSTCQVNVENYFLTFRKHVAFTCCDLAFQTIYLYSLSLLFMLTLFTLEVPRIVIMFYWLLVSGGHRLDFIFKDSPHRSDASI